MSQALAPGWAAVLLALSFAAKSMVDVLTQKAGANKIEQWGPFFDARTSWKNKYKPGSLEAGQPVPRFWLSTTVLAWTTDFWHLADSIYLTSWQLVLALSLPYPWLWWQTLPIIKLGGGLVFEGLYHFWQTKPRA